MIPAESLVFNEDCMAVMARYPDKYFDLAVVDPPYGGNVERTGNGWAAQYGKKIRSWDIAPGDEYFSELFRVSKSQIIWGGNYFSLPPTRSFIVWVKPQIPDTFTMAMAEYAWTSFDDNAKVFSHFSHLEKGRFHPTQKPVPLYDWIFAKYAKPGFKILDTHLGSGSSRIAAHNAGLDFVGAEIDPEYFRKGVERFDRETAQIRLF